MSKVKISLEDPEIRRIWNAMLDAQREVESWPAWKRGELAPATGNHSPGLAPKPTEGK